MAFTGTVSAKVETPDTPGTGDYNDDPAIIVHPTDPSRSVVATSNKDYNGSDRGGVFVYDLSGNPVHTESLGTAFNNIDVEYNFGQASPFTDEFTGEFGGEPAIGILVGATGRVSGNLHFWEYDFASTGDEMRPVGTIDPGYGDQPYGFAMGRLGQTHYAFSSQDNGTSVEQWELSESGGSIAAKLVRTIQTNGQVEGIVVDDQNGVVYLSEELGAIKKYGTDPGSGTAHTVIDRVGTGGNLVADIEGLSIYYGPDADTGYLIASSQGESRYAVYDRAGSNAYLGEFAVGSSASGIDGASSTDGLDVSNVNFGGQFSQGMLVIHDNSNTGADSSNFKFVGWDSIAALGGLITGSSHDPRAPVTGQPTEPTDPGTIPPPPFFTINTTDAPVRTYTGTSRNDTLKGSSLAEKFDGKAGSDSYSGSTGDDTYIVVETGDRISSDSGGQDTVEYWNGAGYILPPNIEHILVQGAAARTVTANSDDNILTAAAGTGTVTFNGMTGNDNIRVGDRNVIATGGDGNDIFRYAPSAVGDGNEIRDFRLGYDLLDLSAAVASSSESTTDPFSNGVLSLVNSGPNARLMYDQDGSAGNVHQSTEIVELIGVQVGAGIDQAHVYTGI